MRQMTRKRKRGESLWLTSSPTKRFIEEKEKNAKKNRQKKKHFPKKTAAATGKNTPEPRKSKGGRQEKDTKEECCLCGEGVVAKSELWLKCGMCGKWAHEACTSGMTSRGFVCDFCR